jgi:glycosyltransferase involved in cell wall biosynthesis
LDKVSVIATVFNEEETVGKLIESLLTQSRTPDEIVIADGGSTDRTVDIVKEYAARNPIVKLVVEPGNRSVGRNAAVAATTSDIIACTDAGCEVDSRWLEEITKPFTEDVDVVSGFYEPLPQTVFEECAGVISMPALSDIDPNTFLPSTRSVAFRRSAWKKVGGFPTQYRWNEDTVFDTALKEAGCRFTFAPEAIVRWRPRGSFTRIYVQHRQYAYGDVESGTIWRHYYIAAARYGITAALILASPWYPWTLLPVAAGVALYARKLNSKARRRGIKVTPKHTL